MKTKQGKEISMKKFLTTCLLTTGICFTAHAGLYVQGGIGAGLNDGSISRENIYSDYKNSPVLSVSAGYELPVPFIEPRAEIEYLRIRPDAKNNLDSTFDGVFLNGYTNIPLIPFIDPYIGAGIGMSRFDHKNSTALQGMAGLEYGIPFLPITFSGEYRYMKVTEAGGKWDSKSKFHSNIFMLKARYSF